MAQSKEARLVTISPSGAYDLDRQGPPDSARHRQRIQQAVWKDLHTIVATTKTPIITAVGDEMVGVRIQNDVLPRFRYAQQTQGGFAAAAGIGRRPTTGNQEGTGSFEAQVPWSQIRAALFEEFGLPDLAPHLLQATAQPEEVYAGVGRHGPKPRLDLIKTARANMERNAASGNGARVAGISPIDHRFRASNSVPRREGTNAVIIAMGNVSGGMDEFQTYIARSFYSWMATFLRAKYDNVRVVFVTHHTRAQMVDEQGFFRMGMGGGTKVSETYKLALKTIDDQFNPRNWKVYPFHFSDGDNWSIADNELVVRLARELGKRSEVFGYGEIRQYERGMTALMSSLTAGLSQDPNFMSAVIRSPGGVSPALRHFFRGYIAETREGRI